MAADKTLLSYETHFYAAFSEWYHFERLLLAGLRKVPAMPS